MIDEELAAALVGLFHPPAELQPVPLNASDLEPIYEGLAGRLPSLYEHLILRFTWPEQDLQRVFLLANPGPGKLLKNLLYDRNLAAFLLPKGLVPFARQAGGGWDPVCFNLASPLGPDDCEVVRFDHEGILCFNRLSGKQVLAPSFRDFVKGLIAHV